MRGALALKYSGLAGLMLLLFLLEGCASAVPERLSWRKETPAAASEVERAPRDGWIVRTSYRQPALAAPARAAASPTSSPHPSLWPIGEETRTVASPFGIRGRNDMHKGMDIKGPYRTPVVATADGVVKFSGQMRGYGNVIMVDHGAGIETRYGHLDSRLANAGEKVRQGMVIGKLGQTGNASMPHVHYEVRVNGRPVDPAVFLGGPA